MRRVEVGISPSNAMAAALDRLRAYTFEERDASLPKLSVCKGAFVKVGARQERFWCRVQHVGTDTLRVVVDNELLHLPWQRGHELVIQHRHVLEVADVADLLRFRSLVANLGSPWGAAHVWREARVVAGVAVSPRPDTLFVVPSK